MQKKFKIAYVLTSVAYGGLEKVASNILQAYNRDRFEIIAIVMIRFDQRKNPFITMLDNSGYRYHKVYLAQAAANNLQRVSVIIRLYRNIYRIVRENSFDLIHSNGTLSDILTIPIATVTRIPIISTCHGLISTTRKLSFYNFINRQVLRLSSTVIAVSDSIKADLERSGIKEANIKVIPNSLGEEDNSDFKQSSRSALRKEQGIEDDEFVIGYVGRVSFEKGLEHLIRAVPMMLERCPNVTVMIIGEGPDRKRLEEIARQLPTEERIRFVGFQNDVKTWLATSDLFVLPSLTEGTPMALLEAMSQGLPVIASKVGGVPDIIKSGANGLLVHPGNAHEIADAICMLYKDENLRIKLGREARVTVQIQYGVKQWIKTIENEYQRVVAG